MLDHVLPQPPHLLIPKFISPFPLVSPKPLHPLDISPILPDSPATLEDDLSSPHSPLSGSGSYSYPNRSTSSFDSPNSPPDIYDNNLPPDSYSAPSQSFSEGSSTPSNFEFIDSDGTVRATNYLSDSPSPADIPPSSSYTHGISATHSQSRRSSQISASYFLHDRYDGSPDIDSDRHSRHLSDKYSTDNTAHFQVPSLDQRRMSEPAILPSPNSYSTSESHRLPYSTSSLSIPRSSSYAHSLQRGASTGSLRDLRLAHLDYPPQLSYPGWKGHRSHPLDGYHEDDGFDGSISPLQPDFSGGFGPRGPYSPSADNFYGTSPPGTGTSSSSLGPLSPVTDPFGHDARDPNSKTYSFVALPGNTIKKRPRRRYDEIERLYQCSFPECNKAYGTLNHLNAHVTMQKHGAKRQPSEFKELRKQWRKAKKSTSPGPSRSSNMGLRHDSHEYRVRRNESNTHTPLYTRQPPYHAGLASSEASTGFSEAGGRMTIPIDASRYQVDTRGSHGRQRYGSWQGLARPGPHQYLSSSLPSQSHFPQDSLADDPRAPQRSRSHSSLDMPLGRLPPDSTLLTPLPGYQPSLLPTLQEGENQDIHFSAGTEYEIFDDGHDGRSQVGHGSHGDSEEKF